MTSQQRIMGSVLQTEDSRSDGTTHDRLDGRRSDEVRSTGALSRCTMPASLTPPGVPSAFFRSPSVRSVSSPATVQSVVRRCGYCLGRDPDSAGHVCSSAGVLR